MEDAKSVGDEAGLFAGRYRLEAILGRGGNAEVTAALDRSSGAPVAIKRFRNLDATGSLLRELSALRSLEHPNIARVLDFGLVTEARGEATVYMVLERVEGHPLVPLTQTEDEAQRLARWTAAALALADAVAYLHGQGVLHGDLSPANVLLEASGAIKLVDFGLSSRVDPFAEAGSAAGPPQESLASVGGTLGYLAPEALQGEVGPAVDLFAMGATLFHAWTGVAPFGTGLEAVRRMFEGPAPLASSLRAGLPPSWDQWLSRLLRLDPLERTASARRALREAHFAAGSPDDGPVALAARPAGDVLAGVFVGRNAERAQLGELLAATAEGLAPAGVVFVTGPPGSGRRRLMDHALLETRLKALAESWPPFQIERFAEPVRLAHVMAEAGRATEAGRSGDLGDQAWAGAGALLASWEARAALQPLVVSLPECAEADLLGRLAGSDEPSGRLLLLCPGLAAPPSRSGREVALGPLTIDDVRTLVRRGGDEIVGSADEVAEGIFAASGGHPATVDFLAREAFASPNQPPWLQALGVSRGPPGVQGLSGTLSARFEAGWRLLSDQERRLLALVALLPEKPGVEPPILGPLGDLVATAACVRRGWLRRAAGGALELASPLAWRAVLARLDDPALREIVTAAPRWLPEADPRQADLRLALGDRQGAVACLVELACRAKRDGDPGGAASAWTRAFAIEPNSLSPGDRLSLVDVLEVYARYDEALAVLAAPVAGVAPEIRAALVERESAMLARRGSLAAARRRLSEVLADPGWQGEKPAGIVGPPDGLMGAARALLTSRLARVTLAEGDAAQALALAEPAVGQPGRAGLVALEAAVMALGQLGRVAEAASLLARHTSLPPGEVGGSIAGRHAHLRGYLAQLSGRLGESRDHYRVAVASYERVGERHALAVARFNLGCLLAEEGTFAEALTTLELAGRELGRLGVEVDRALARFNVGVLQVRLGDLEEAQRIVTSLRGPGTRRLATTLPAALAAYLEGDIRRREGRAATAAALYGDAELALDRAGMGWLAATAAFARVEALVEGGYVEQAERVLDQRTQRAGMAEAGPVTEARLLAMARLRLAQAALDPPRLLRLGEELQALARLADDQGRRPAALRAALLSARLFRSAGDEVRAPAALSLVKAIGAALKAQTPARYRGALDADPDLRALAHPARPQADDVTWELARRAERAEGRLRRLARINKRLNSELRLQRVLEILIDTVIELTDAERGFLLLRDDGGELAIRVARNIDAETMSGPPLELSRSIARQVAASGSAIVTLDAVDDDRFKAAVSVSDLRLRSILAVPLAVKGKVAGVIYVDHRLRRGAFDDDDVALVVDFAEQGALAIENARVLAELRRRERQVESLNRRLRSELERRGDEIAEMKQEIHETRTTERFRYDYSRLVGRTPRMLAVFRLLDRVTATALPVVILGESGTGKELVARAVHFNGPRRERPFVSENCAAIPETLLESTLFGAVRGAFTGADRDIRGLFSVANGGTLFLDEVAEMSPALQGKLLRVLQDGEFRRVGGERPERVDVRIIAATNKDLERLVEEKKFRQDLFFRLCVVRVDLPPLRDRREDIPLLVDSFLRAQAEASRSPQKGIEPAALARLSSYRWPGNVRELENEILRAAAFAGSSIGVGDLSPRITGGPDQVADDDPASLTLKSRVERLERAMIREALTRTGSNQTKAAEVLGLSRFGLQKKLQRYRMSP